MNASFNTSITAWYVLDKSIFSNFHMKVIMKVIVADAGTITQ